MVEVSLPDASDLPQIDDILIPDARVCFTGTAVVDGKIYEREEMEMLAYDHGLQVAPRVSKTRCCALIAADLATQSGKARKATELDKLIFSAEAFIRWIEKR